MSAVPPNPFKPIKRVVTGHNAAGQSTTIFVDEPDMQPIRPPIPNLIGRLWITKETPANNDDSVTDTSKDTPKRLNLIEPNGSFASIVEMAPGTGSPMHRTSSIDYLILISGQVTLILEDGSEQTVTEPGSIIVQRGTLHRWQNRGDTWNRFSSVQIDAKPVEVKDEEGNAKALAEEFLFPKPLPA